MSDREEAPQGLDEKLQRPREGGGRARATLEQLNKRWHTDANGEPSPHPTLDPKHPADSVVVFSLSGHEHWIRVSNALGKDTVYEKHDVPHETAASGRGARGAHQDHQA